MTISEDFWISAALKTIVGVGTKRVRCIRPQNGGDLELCACSMKEAGDHVPATVGQEQVDEDNGARRHAIQAILKQYGYVPLTSRNPSAVEDVKTRHEEISMDLFSARKETKSMFEQCLFWY